MVRWIDSKHAWSRKGYTQNYGINYQETFSPVAKINSIRVLLSLAANNDWPLQQLDVKNAFLHGNLEEEVYMEVPPSFEKYFNSNQVCRLKKALYGLKQSPRAWFERFSKSVIQFRYQQSRLITLCLSKLNQVERLRH